MIGAYAAGTAAGNIAAYGGTAAYPLPGRWGDIPLGERAAQHILDEHGLTIAALAAIAARAVETREYASGGTISSSSGRLELWGGVAIAYRVNVGDMPPYKPHDWSRTPELGGPFGGWVIVIARRTWGVGTVIKTAFPLEYHVNDPDYYLGEADPHSKWMRVFPLPPVATWTLP